MKANKIITGLTLGVLGVVAFAPSALAASTDSQTTDGKVTITAGTDPTFEGFIKPGTYNDKIAMDATYGKNGSTTATLRFNWVPNFDFGTVSATAYDQVIDSKIHAYTYDDTSVGTGGNIYQFVQVQDMTGNASSNFKVSLSATTFADSPTSPTTSLTNTRIRLSGFTTTNNQQYNTTVTNGSLLSALAISGDYVELTPGSSYELMKTTTSTGNTSNGSVSSLVFNNAYAAATDTTATTNDQVQLFVPSNEMIAGNYSSTLTWSLDDTL
ncbi:WxL domain-containing protein [Enterococcus sp. LJL90]